MKKIIFTLFFSVLAFNTVAAGKEPQIESNQSSIQDGHLINNIASSAIAMGVKEPLVIVEEQIANKRVLTVSGSNHTSCKVPVSDSDQMAGISCK